MAGEQDSPFPTSPEKKLQRGPRCHFRLFKPLGARPCQAPSSAKEVFPVLLLHKACSCPLTNLWAGH